MPEAIASVLSQAYTHTEVIIVDDGSEDNTAEVSKQYQEVRYIYQKNSGLSAARNRGIQESTGSLMVFLDADDWLLPDAISTNVDYLTRFSELAFVAGAHEIVDEQNGARRKVQKDIITDYYCMLLERNYIGMHATVMFRRWVFDQYQYDTTLKSCEDYDLYLKIARDHPILSHKKIIAAYRFHDNNMSANYKQMLHYALLVLERQRDKLRSS